MIILPALDIDTLLFVYQMTATLLAAVILGGAWQARGRYGLWFWAGSFAAIAVSQTLRFGAIAVLGIEATPPLGHIGGVVAAALLLLGVLSYLERRLPILTVAAFCTLFALISLTSFFAQLPNWISLSSSVFGAGVLRAMAALALWRALRIEGGFPLTMATAVIGLSALAEVLRAITVAVPVTGSLAAATTSNSLWLAAYICLTLLQGFAILLLVNDSLQRDIRALIEYDPLTGLLNRRGLFQRFECLAGLSQRTAAAIPVVIAMADVDHFKRINDNHGHRVGDQVLHELGGRILEHMRTSDLAVRMGGEEFALIWVGARADQAHELSERLRIAIESEPLATDAGPIAITLSLGVAVMRPEGESLNDLLVRADLALYRAKAAGRNRVELAA